MPVFRCSACWGSQHGTAKVNQKLTVGCLGFRAVIVAVYGGLGLYGLLLVDCLCSVADVRSRTMRLRICGGL